MRCDRILHFSLCDPWSSNVKWNPDVFVKSSRLSGRQAVLSNMEAIVAGEHDVSIIQLVAFFQASYKRLDQLIHTLQ